MHVHYEKPKFALRKLEDMPYSEDGSLSGATGLSGLASEIRSLQKMLEKVHRVFMNAPEDWEPNAWGRIDRVERRQRDTDLVHVSICTDSAILKFLDDVRSIKPGTFPDNLKKLSTNPVNLFALYRFLADIQNIKSKIKRINTEDDRSITQPTGPSLHKVVDIWLTGFENHGDRILQRLVHNSIQTLSLELAGNDPLFVKTTLAEKIYQSTEVKNHFEACFWFFQSIHVKTDYQGPIVYQLNLIDILRKMLLKLGDANLLGAYDEDYLVSRLRHSLSGKRCLVVVHDEREELWTLVNAVFTHGNNCSRLLIISEESREREGLSSDYRYKLPFLQMPAHMLNLPKELRKMDFFLVNEDGHFSKPIDEFNQSSILKSVQRWHFLRQKVPYGSMLCIYWNKYYENLPCGLKICYLYTASIFPLSSIILADSLIRLWIIEGIIPHQEGTTMENIAESYLEQLAQRGFLHIFGVYYHNQANHPIRGIILHYYMHEYLHEEMFSSTKFEEGIISPVRGMRSVGDFDKDIHWTDSLKDVRGLVLRMQYQFNQISSFEKGSILERSNHRNLHSLFFFHYVAPVASPPFTFVRVLAVFSSHLSFPEEYAPCWLDELINLRYLGFIVCLVEGGSLGKTLDRLVKLEILDLSESFVSGLSEFIKNNKKVKVVGPVKEELPAIWSPIPDMFQ